MLVGQGEPDVALGELGVSHQRLGAAKVFEHLDYLPHVEPCADDPRATGRIVAAANPPCIRTIAGPRAWIRA
ncbi:MAG: hypothetical protein MSC30_20470, partial [Gaiellaceae bacterium MAG52_C11]|nr:hypothetical protein [Candidatus Gaiellasilicea maunaloa]